MARRASRRRNTSRPSPNPITRDISVAREQRSPVQVNRALDALYRSIPDALFNTGVRSRAGRQADLALSDQSDGAVISRGGVVTANGPASRSNLDRDPAMTLRAETNDPRRDRSCKRRPDRNTGSGNGRPFVPWCK